MRGIAWVVASYVAATTAACSADDNSASDRNYFYDGATIAVPSEIPEGFIVIPGPISGRYIVLGPNKDRAPKNYRSLYTQ